MVFFLSFNVIFCFTKGSEETSYKLGKVFVSHITDKGLQSRIFKEFSSSTEGGGKQKTASPIRKWGKDGNGYFTKEDIQIANKYMKIYSTSLAIRETQIKSWCDIPT